jgi:hypothetical protein
MDDVEIKNPVDTRKRLVSMEPKISTPKPEVIFDPVLLSDNIQKFEKKILKQKRVDPFARNLILEQQKDNNTPIIPTAEQMVTDHTYNLVGKVLGIDTKKEWNMYYDKVYQIVEWVKGKLNTNKVETIVKYISERARSVPTMGARRIDDLFIFSKLNK